MCPKLKKQLMENVRLLKMKPNGQDNDTIITDVTMIQNSKQYHQPEIELTPEKIPRLLMYSFNPYLDNTSLTSLENFHYFVMSPLHFMSVLKFVYVCVCVCVCVYVCVCVSHVFYM